MKISAEKGGKSDDCCWTVTVTSLLLQKDELKIFQYFSGNEKYVYHDRCDFLSIRRGEMLVIYRSDGKIERFKIEYVAKYDDRSVESTVMFINNIA